MLRFLLLCDSCAFFLDRRRFKFAGGSPAATYFSCFAKKSKQKKATPGETPPDGGPLRYSTRRAAAELALVAKRQGLRQSSPTPPGAFALLGVSQGTPAVQ